MNVTLIQKYFDLSPLQEKQFEALGHLYQSLNEKINVISRKDISNLYCHHILHSLAIAKCFNFKEKTSFLDLGTGGGLPGIPLAILLPKCQFLLIDGRAKKIKVVNEIIERLELQNCKGQAVRSEELRHKFDYVLARAVTRLERLIPLSMRLVKLKGNNALPNGLITLKGGDLENEINALTTKTPIDQFNISSFFEEPFFESKHILYVPK